MRVVKLEPATLCYRIPISDCDKCEPRHPALPLLSKMWASKLEPDVVSYRIPISARGKCEQWQQASLLLSEMW
eukprot:3375464-Pyramimonas_sp.AAC.1